MEFENKDSARSAIENRRIRYAVKVLLAIGIPFTGYRSLLDFSLARYMSATLLLCLFVTLLLFLTTLYIVKRPQLKDSIYRVFFFISMILLGAELVYLIGIAGELNKLPWFYIFPLLVFNIYGYRNGTILTASLLSAVLITWYLYPLDLDITLETLRNRFVQSVILVTVVFLFAERQRDNQQEELIDKQHTLIQSEKTLHDINILLKAENMQRESAEKDLMQYRKQLEQLVKDRTAELEKSNRYLVEEIKEREQAESERLKLEGQLRQSQKMEAIGVLAGGIAHDFNNILGTMMGYSELMLSELPAENSHKGYADAIYRAGERAADLISQILTFSRAEEPELKHLNVPPFLIDVINMTRATLPSTIEIRQKIQVDDNLIILANKTQIHQVIINLCSNAAHAMQEGGGVLEIQLSEVYHPDAAYQPPPAAADSYLELVVRDSGSGIPAEVKERIFDPFFTTKKANEATGLGLSIVHGIVESHKGRIRIETAVAEGTAFYLLFPVIKEEVPKAEAAVSVEFQSGSHILIAEDESELARLYEISLTAAGFQVTLADNGMEALEKFRSKPDLFDLLFTDQIMPKMTGLELSREVLKIRPDMLILLATGYDISLSQDEMSTINIIQCLKKPVKVSELIKLIGHSLAEVSV